MLIQFREKINTECRIANPILNVQAIKIDANSNSLKQRVGCKALKSCDYLKKRSKKLYFVEISDFNAQFEDISKKSTSHNAAKQIKLEVRLKLSDTLLIFQEICKKFEIKTEKISTHKVLLTICKDKKSDVVVFDRLARELTRHYCPTHFASIQIIPYTELEKIFTK